MLEFGTCPRPCERTKEKTPPTKSLTNSLNKLPTNETIRVTRTISNLTCLTA